MAIKLTKGQFDRAIDGMVNLKYDGTWSYKVGQHNGLDVAIVLGWTDAYAKGGAKYQIKLFGKTWTLCGKIAIRVGNTETDFEYDWVMPVSKDGIDYDNEHAINDESFDYLVDEAEFVMVELKNGTLKIEE